MHEPCFRIDFVDGAGRRAGRPEPAVLPLLTVRPLQAVAGRLRETEQRRFSGFRRGRARLRQRASRQLAATQHFGAGQGDPGIRPVPFLAQAVYLTQGHPGLPLGRGQPFLERSVHYKGLEPASVAKLAALAEKQGMEAVQSVYRSAKDCEARDRMSGAAKQRITFCVYFYSEPLGNEPLKKDE